MLQFRAGAFGGRGGVMQLKPLPEVDILNGKEVRDRLEKQKEADEKRLESLSGFERYMEEHWQEARNAKNTDIYQDIVDGFTMREGAYSPLEFARLDAFGRSVIYMPLVQEKCRSMESKLRDLFFPSQGFSWSVEPTPNPSLSSDDQVEIVGEVMMEYEELMSRGFVVSQEAMESRIGELNESVMAGTAEEASAKSKRMQALMRDQLAEGNWEEAMMNVIFFFVSSPAGMLRGPIRRKRKKLVWGDGAAVEAEVDRIEWEALNPLDVFPLPRSKDGDDAYFIRHFYSMSDLLGMTGLPGANVDNIRRVVKAYGERGLQDAGHRGCGEGQAGEQEQFADAQRHERDRDVAVRRPRPRRRPAEVRAAGSLRTATTRCMRSTFTRWTTVVIHAALNEGECRPRLFKAFFDGQPNGWWGDGVPQMLSPYQDMVNLLARSIENNVAFSSGPQVVINDVERIADDELREIDPFRLWSFHRDPGAVSDRKAMEFYQPNMLSHQLMSVYNFYDQKASEIIGVPEPPYSGLSGAAKGTASGLSIAIGQGNKHLRYIAAKVADEIIRPALQGLYEYNMLYSDDEGVKGDAQCVVKGMESEIAKEQRLMRAVELAGMTANPVDSSVVGLEGRARMLREISQLMDLESFRDIFPDDDEDLALRVMKNAEMMQAVMGGAPPGDGSQVGSPTRMDASGTGAAGGQETSVYRGSGPSAR